MLDSLDFSLPPSSTAVVDRRQHVRAYPTSASTLTPTGTRTCRIRLGGDDFVDASSIRLVFTIINGDTANSLVPLTGPWGCLSQVYLRSNGTELENIPNYGRHHQMFGWNFLSLQEQWGEAAVTGMAGSWGTGDAILNYPAMGVIPANGSYTVMMKLHLGLLSSGKLLPTRYAPMELEISLNSVLSDWLTPTTQVQVQSQNFSLSNVQLLYDAYVLDEAVQESFYRALLSSRVLSVPTITVYQMVQPIAPGSTSLSFASVRAFSRLSHCFLTFRAAGARSYSFVCPTTIANNTGVTPTLSDQCPTARLSIGPHYWPDPQPAATIPEFYYMLQKALPGIPNVTRDNFINQTFTIAFDVRKVPNDPTSAISTRSGDLLRVDLNGLTANAASECWLTLFAFSVVAIRESGVTLLT